MAKALTIIEPYPTYIMMGIKRIETRSYPTKYRGTIYIHVSKRKPRKEWKTNPFYTMAEKFGFHFGMVVCKAELVNCYQMTEENISEIDEVEKACGFWEPGRYAWVLDNVEPVDPFKARGYQIIWNLDI